MHVIGLTGAMGAGKDYTFGSLVEGGYDVIRLSFADQVRHEIENVVASGMYCSTLWQKPYPPEIRSLMQWWGTDLRRAQDPEYWIKVMIRRLEEFDDQPIHNDTAFVLTDVRFPNELEVVTRFGGTSIQVWAPSETRRLRLGLSPDELEERENHISEQALVGLDRDINLASETRHGLRGLTPQDTVRWNDLKRRIGRRREG